MQFVCMYLCLCMSVCVCARERLRDEKRVLVRVIETACAIVRSEDEMKAFLNFCKVSQTSLCY